MLAALERFLADWRYDDPRSLVAEVQVHLDALRKFAAASDEPAATEPDRTHGWFEVPSRIPLAWAGRQDLAWPYTELWHRD